MKKASKEEGRIIGIVHRIKRTADNEARPTLVCILDPGKKKPETLQLETEGEELDFLLGRFPTKFRQVEPGEDLNVFPVHQIKWKKAGKDFNPDEVPENHRKKVDKQWLVADKAPIAFEGFRAGDTVAMCLGGSGDRFAHALARHGQDIGARVFRLAPKRLKANRPDDDKDNDHLLLAQLYAQQPALFKEATPAELSLIRIRMLFDQRMDAQDARKVCAQRLGQRLIGRIYCNIEGKYPEGAVENLIAAEKVNSAVLNALLAEEKARENEMAKEVIAHPLYRQIFEPILGVGPRIAATIIALIGDIRRFETPAAFKQYCGVAPNAAGNFQRARRGEKMSWRPEIRQALWLFVDQANRRPDSEWGRVLVAEKARLRAKYPEVVVEERPDPKKPSKNKKVKMYTDGHIAKKAGWHMLGKFCDWLYKDWNKFLEGQDQAAGSADVLDTAA